MKKGLELRGYLQGFQTIFSRNALLIIAINVVYSYGNYMKNGFRSLVAAENAGANPTMLGAAVTIFLICGFLSRVPFGKVCDLLRGKLKPILALSFVIRAICWMGFLLIRSPKTLFLFYALDGVLYAFHGTVLAATIAVSVDKRAMGSAYALMIGITDIITGSAKAAGISLYKSGGLLKAVVCIGGLMLVCALLSLLLDARRLGASAGPVLARAPGRLFGSKLEKRFILFAVIANMPAVIFTGESNFFPIYAESLKIPYLTSMTIGGEIYGVMSCVVGILCDLVEPRRLILAAAVGQMLAPFLWATGAAAPINAGLLLFYVTRYFGTAIRIQGMKAVRPEKQGSFQAVFMAMFDLLSIVSSAAIGWLTESRGYEFMWVALGVWGAIALISYVLVSRPRAAQGAAQ